MPKIVVRTLVAAVIALSMVGASPAGAVTSFKNCDAMHKVRPYGVAKSYKAARKQVRTGHYTPYVDAPVRHDRAPFFEGASVLPNRRAACSIHFTSAARWNSSKSQANASTRTEAGAVPKAPRSCG